MTDKPEASSDHSEAAFLVRQQGTQYRNPYLRALGIATAILIGLGLVITVNTYSSYAGASSGLALIGAGLVAGLIWLLAGAVVHAVRSSRA